MSQTVRSAQTESRITPTGGGSQELGGATHINLPNKQNNNNQINHKKIPDLVSHLKINKSD
jgi:hypothetical protein